MEIRRGNGLPVKHYVEMFLRNLRITRGPKIFRCLLVTKLVGSRCLSMWDFQEMEFI